MLEHLIRLGGDSRGRLTVRTEQDHARLAEVRCTSHSDGAGELATVDGHDRSRGDVFEPARVGTDARLKRHAGLRVADQLVGRRLAADQFPADHELVAVVEYFGGSADHAVEQRQLAAVGVENRDRRLRRVHAGQVDHERVAAPALADARAGVGHELKRRRGRLVGGQHV